MVGRNVWVARLLPLALLAVLVGLVLIMRNRPKPLTRIHKPDAAGSHDRESGPLKDVHDEVVDVHTGRPYARVVSAERAPIMGARVFQWIENDERAVIARTDGAGHFVLPQASIDRGGRCMIVAAGLVQQLFFVTVL